MHGKLNDAPNRAFMNTTLLHIILAYHIFIYFNVFTFTEGATSNNTHICVYILSFSHNTEYYNTKIYFIIQAR